FLDPKLMAEIANKIGPFKDHLRDILIKELEMQDVRIQKIEADLHSAVVVPAGWLAKSEAPAKQTAKDYEKLLGRPVTRTEMLGVHGEAGPLNVLALFSYVLKYKGIDMSEYDINSHYYPKYGRRHVLTFGSAVQGLFEYLEL